MNRSIKPIVLFVSSLLLIGSMQLQSCKKKNPTTDPKKDTPTDYLCKGNGETNYLPLKIGNKWEYSSSSWGSFAEEVTTTSTFGGKTYFKVHYTETGNALDYYYRMATNGDIYKYRDADLAEYLDIPANPTMGQVIATYTSGATRKVTGVDLTITTGSCTYSGLIKIEDLTSSGSNISTYYYMKGLGFVQKITFGAIDLDTITLN